jgi:hypothetical protein
MPVFLGGLVRKIADTTYRREPDAEDEPQGILYGSGLIAGASILGIAAAMLGFLPASTATRIPPDGRDTRELAAALADNTSSASSCSRCSASRCGAARRTRRKSLSGKG